MPTCATKRRTHLHKIHVLHDGQPAELGIKEIFDPEKYSQLIAMTGAMLFVGFNTRVGGRTFILKSANEQDLRQFEEWIQIRQQQLTN
ncbi:hypothetical protein OS909_05115 [Limosilactobacillus fermentum]|uniref:hypothetical protein n=1 Tax=Limosilactobacillus fermentum TaxID=1613 RepID=UPI00292E829D|nr:hypothetical protein [Limosilactobacillus fermentum]WNY95861.1 hypothetical protein OS909_05115 [Limosilactobacillus fermentum]